MGPSSWLWPSQERKPSTGISSPPTPLRDASRQQKSYVVLTPRMRCKITEQVRMTAPGFGQEGFEVVSPSVGIIIWLHSTHLLRILWAEMQGHAAAKGHDWMHWCTSQQEREKEEVRACSKGLNAALHVSAGERRGSKGLQSKLIQRLTWFPGTIKPTYHMSGRHARGSLMAWPQMRPHNILPICPSVIMSSPRCLTVGTISIPRWMTQICSVQTNKIYLSIPSSTRSLPRGFSTTWFGDKHNVRSEKLWWSEC